jgi:hypothetical protein
MQLTSVPNVESGVIRSSSRSTGSVTLLAAAIGPWDFFRLERLPREKITMGRNLS